MQTKDISLFSDVSDPRVVNRCRHKLGDILFIALSTLLCNGEDFEDMVEFGIQRHDWLLNYLELPHGIPCSDTFNRVLQRLAPDELLESLTKDGQALLTHLQTDQICLDGKRIKGVSPTSRGNKGLYILSAWASEQGLCIGQSKVEDKSNEITAIPTLLTSLELKDCLVSIDAIGCQKEIAAQIVGVQADYLLSLKANQKITYEDVIWLFNVAEGQQSDEQWEYDHSRYETRNCTIVKLAQQQKSSLFADWKGLTTLVRVQSTRTIKGISKSETRYYLSSSNHTDPAYFNRLVRGHWSIENKLHWHLDVTFEEDASRARSGNAPENLNILRKMALQRISRMEDKLSLKKRRYRASMNTKYIDQILNMEN